MPNLNTGILSALPVVVPPLLEQHAIAHILGALDGKIELNAKMNRTLEAMARAIFKSWFVDFDPVRAKMEGHKPYGMDDATAALFPDSFEESELGLVPKGWKTGTVDDFATIQRTMLDPCHYPEEQFDHYSIPAYDQGHMPSMELGGAIKSTKFLVPERCVLLSKLNPRFPRVWMPQISDGRRSICSTEFLVTLPRRAYNREFVYGVFASAEFQTTLSTLVTGTSSSHQRVRAENVQAMATLVPSQEITQVYAASVAPLCSMIVSNRQASCSVAAVRDTLLPKLISGQLRVKDAEKIVEGLV
jgi:type I restriction enzyme S subunit